MVGWHHQLNGHEFEQAPGDGERQGNLACCSPRGCKELGTTEYLTHTTLVSLSPFPAESPRVCPSDVPNFYSHPPSILWWFCSFKSRACLLPSHCSVASDCIALSRMLLFSHSVASNSARPQGLWPARLLCLWNFLGRSIGVGCHFFLQGIFLTQR